MVAEALNPSLTDSPNDFLAFLLRTGCKHQAVKRAPVRALGERAKNGNTSIIQPAPSQPCLPPQQGPCGCSGPRSEASQSHMPLCPARTRRQHSQHAEGEDPGAPCAASHTGDRGVGVAAQELCRGQGGAVQGCGQALLALFLVYSVPRTPPAGFPVPPDSQTLDVTHSPWKMPSPAQGLLPPSHQIKPPAGG